jgi:hypothetical protein
MRTSAYFIKKQDKAGNITSDLASYCIAIQEEPEEDKPTMKVL